jgi:hypothetical protein
LCGDFAVGLTAAIARSATKKREAIQKAKEVKATKGKEVEVNGALDDVVSPPSTRQSYKPDL